MNEPVKPSQIYWTITYETIAGRTECDTTSDEAEAFSQARSRYAEPLIRSVVIEANRAGATDDADHDFIPGSRWIFDAKSPTGRQAEPA